MDLLHDLVTTEDGTQLRTTRTLREPHRPDMVVIPPPGTSPGFIEPALAAFGAHFNVLSWEPRCGDVQLPRREAVDAAAELARHEGDFLAVLDRHAWISEDLSVVAYCAGAPIAMHLAATLPDAVTRLALVSGAYFIAPELASQTQYERDLQRLVEQLVAGPDAAPAVYRFCIDSQRARDGQAPLDRALRYPFRCEDSLHAYALTLAALRRADALHIAARVGTPTLVYAARSDRVAASGAARLIAAALPAGRLTLAADGEHYDFPRADPAVIDAVIRFFADCGAIAPCRFLS